MRRAAVRLSGDYELRIGARKSPLARAQADDVAVLLAGHGVRSTFVGITTTGDVDSRQLTEIGGTGVFATAVRGALRDGSVDLAVHSLKDLPTLQPDDLEIVAIPEREDSRDVLVGCRLDELEDGSRVGTGALAEHCRCWTGHAAEASGWRSFRFAATSVPAWIWSRPGK